MTGSARILLIDNYDSFVYNLARYFQELGAETVVRRNDAVSLRDIERLAPAAVVLSPGPCTPDEAGICLEVVAALGPSLPMLGVCLGHQAMGQALGARIRRADEPVHGRSSLIEHDSIGLFSQCPSPLQVARYHSLVVDSAGLPDCLEVTARAPDGTIMALRHRSWPMYGVQFHPESILTRSGHRILLNFMELAGLHGVLPVLPETLTLSQGPEDDFYQREIETLNFRPI